MYEIQCQDDDLGWHTRTTARDLQPLLATYHLMCEDWKAGKLTEMVNVRLVLVMLQEHPA